MSKPYLNINSMTYSNPVLGLNYTFYKLRGGGSFSILGFSNSTAYNELNSNSIANGLTYETLTFSCATLGTAANTTYNDATSTITFGGTAANGTTNVRIQIAGVQLSSATASGTTVSVFLNSMVGGFSFGGAATGFSATSSGNLLQFTAPTNTGNYYNGLTVSITAVAGASSFTYSVGNSFSNGTNVYAIELDYLKLGTSDTFTFTV